MDDDEARDWIVRNILKDGYVLSWTWTFMYHIGFTLTPSTRQSIGRQLFKGIRIDIYD